MCVRTLSSYPAHLLFWHKCLSNEEQIETPPPPPPKKKKFKYFAKKNVCEQKDRLQWK